MSVRAEEREYRNLLKTPKRGWAHADEAHGLASLCDIIGRQQCMNGLSIWLWAKAQGVDEEAMLRLAPRTRREPAAFVAAVLGNEPFENQEGGSQ